MTLTRRSLAAPAPPSYVAARTCALLFVATLLIGLLPSAAACVAVTRTHRLPVASQAPMAVAPQSAHSKDSEKPASSSAVAKGKASSKPTHKAGVTPTGPAAKAHARKRKPQEPEIVDDPILLHRAFGNSPKAKGERSRSGHSQEVAKQIFAAKPQVASSRSARQRRDAHLATAVAVAASTRQPTSTSASGTAGKSNKLTTDDFLRAAGESVVGQPVDDEATSPFVAAAPALTPSAAQSPMSAQQKPAPIVRRAPPVLAEIAPVSPEPIPNVPAQTVEGFGAEVDLLPPHASSKTAAVAKHAAAAADVDATLTVEDRRQLTDAAMQPLAAPLYTRAGKLIVPMPLKGTREILVHQNQMADDAGLTRIQDDDDLNRMRAQHLLVSFPGTAGLEVNEELPANRRYARPWTVQFVTDIARAYFAKFHEPLRLNSAVRTVDYQLRLQRVNGNAAAVAGETASPHLTGQAIDFGKHGMSVAQIAWMRAALLPLMQAGKIDVEEEFQQACFHISVYASYAPKKRVAPKTELAQLHRE